MEKTQGKEPEPSDHQQLLLKQSEQLNISLIIDTYDDIFSDFDPRPYNERALSEDFLLEVRRRHIPRRKGGLEVRFLVPDSIRDQKKESLIKRRLKNYFKEDAKYLFEIITSRKRKGFIYIFIGIVLLVTLAFLSVNYPGNFWVSIGELLLTPAGWFGMWEGLGKIVERDEKLSRQLELSRQLSESTFNFIPESEAFKGPAIAESEQKTDESVKEQAKESGKTPVDSEPAKKTIKEIIKEEVKK